MQGYAQAICRTRFFVGLKIEVDAPGVLAALRPWIECIPFPGIFLQPLIMFYGNSIYGYGHGLEEVYNPIGMR